MRRRAMAGAALLVLAACSPSPNTVQVSVEAYISAVSLGEASRMLDMSASYLVEIAAAPDEAARKAVEKRHRDRIEQGFIQWEVAKSAGTLQFDPLGVVLIRAIGLGKEGAAAAPLGVRFTQEGTRAVVTTRAITNYEGIRWDSIPTGGRMYLMGMPFGRVVNFATGYDDPANLTLLATVDVQWTFVRLPEIDRPPLAPSDWYLESVTALPETAVAWSRPPAPSP